MLDLMLAANPGVSAPRSVRFVGLSGASNNTIGVHEFEIYNKSGQNVCRLAGYVPACSYSPNANKFGANFTTFPVEYAIDGNSSTWQQTTYMGCATDYSAWLQFDFPKGFDIDYWRFKVEGSWYPSGQGVALQVLDNGQWITVTGNQSPLSWGPSTWFTFTGLSHT